MSGSADHKQQSSDDLFVRRPAVPAAIALMLGIFAHEWLVISPGKWLIVLCVLIILSIVLFRRPALCSVCLILATIISGMAIAQNHVHFYPRDHISAFAIDQPRLGQLELRLDYPPRVLSWPFGQFHAMPPKQIAQATVLRVKTWTGWVDCGGEVLVQVSQPNPRLEQGQIIRVIGRLERPGPAMNPGQFDWASYYREQRILASVNIAEAGNIEILEQHAVGPLAWLRRQARFLLARGFSSNELLDHALLRALVLGDNDPELRDVQEQFRRTGTSHHLAISGMHVAVLGGLVFGICRLLRTGPRASCWLALISVVLYGIVALPSPPVVRSVLLCVAFAVGILHRRSTDAIQLLAVSVIAMLVYHPLDLYNAGFQLSFGTVLGLLIFTRPLLAALPGPDLDERIAMAMQRPTRFSILLAKIQEWAKATLAAGIVAWVVSMPLIALHFEQLNPWAILASILLAPIVFLSLMGGFAKILLTLLLPGLAGTWAGIAVKPVAIMRHTVDWLATFPGADVPFPSPPIWMVILFYGLLLTLLIPWQRPAIRWSSRLAALAGCLLIAIIPLRSGVAFAQSHAGDLKVTLLAIGAGQAAVIEPPGDNAVLIDAGSMGMQDVMHKALGPFLRHAGRREVRSIFISHSNYDHFSAVDDATIAYDVKDIFVAPQFRGQSVENPTAEALLRTLDQLDRPPKQIARGQSFDLGGGAKIEVVWPAQDSPFDANNCSLVLRLTYAGRSVLFTGDIQGPAERELMQSPQAIQADVLVAPHHGSSEITTAAFIDAVSPSQIVCSNDRTLSMKQREFDRITQGRSVYRTHTSGAITVRISPDGTIAIEPYLQQR